MENKAYKPVIKKFLKQDVRVIKTDDGKEYILCKDMFDVLGLVKENGSWASSRKRMLEFLEEIDSTPDVQTLDVRLKDKQSKKGQIRQVECLNIETTPIVLTQFKPTKRRGEEALEIWSDFMKFVKVLLEAYSADKYIVKTKKTQTEAQDEIYNDGGKPMKMNIHVNQIMGYVLQMEEDLSEEPSFIIIQTKSFIV